MAETFQILMVEDNPGDVYLFRRSLQRAGLEAEVTHLEDGALALSYVLRENPYQHAAVPDLVVLDMNLPKRTGTEILSALRQSPTFSGVPVMMMSSSVFTRPPASASEIVTNTLYLTKPMDLAGFLRIGEMVKDLLLATRA